MSAFICSACRAGLAQHVRVGSKYHQSIETQLLRRYTRPSFAPKPVLDLKHIRENPGLYEQNATDRNYPTQARNSWRILELHERLIQKQRELREVRRRNNDLEKEIQQSASRKDGDSGKPKNSSIRVILEETKKLKEELKAMDEWERQTKDEMEALAIEIPNLSSNVTPVGSQPEVIDWIGGETPPRRSGRSHVDIGRELGILDFEASATTSGWGWYFLVAEGTLLEQALIQYALSVAMSRGWKVMTPPSLVYSHIASACGFMPRDQNGETQIYNLANDSHEGGHGSDRPSLVLTGTAEIPFAASQANKTLPHGTLKVAGPSRCYRAEAGARGVDTRGLYRVHEFTKVEMFAWTEPPRTLGTSRFEADNVDSDEEQTPASEKVFTEMLDIQIEILSSLGLHAKILEMPSQDMGASASRKVDMEAFFPSRSSINDGYGEVTSASLCTDYQTRRLGTRMKDSSGKLLWPHTLNGTALAVPRVLACLLENGWDDETKTLHVPEVLRKWMPGELSQISRK